MAEILLLGIAFNHSGQNFQLLAVQSKWCCLLHLAPADCPPCRIKLLFIHADSCWLSTLLPPPSTGWAGRGGGGSPTDLEKILHRRSFCGTYIWFLKINPSPKKVWTCPQKVKLNISSEDVTALGLLLGTKRISTETLFFSMPVGKRLILWKLPYWDPF